MCIGVSPPEILSDPDSNFISSFFAISLHQEYLSTAKPIYQAADSKHPYNQINRREVLQVAPAIPEERARARELSESMPKLSPEQAAKFKSTAEAIGKDICRNIKAQNPAGGLHEY